MIIFIILAADQYFSTTSGTGKCLINGFFDLTATRTVLSIYILMIYLLTFGLIVDIRVYLLYLLMC